MFSSSLLGRGSMVRQLQPTVHLETCQEVVEALQGKVSEVGTSPRSPHKCQVRLVNCEDLPSVEELRHALETRA